jgi:hypothetical protein
VKENYKYIKELVEEGDVDFGSVHDEVIQAMGITGEYTHEFISQLVRFAVTHDLECGETPLAILNDAFYEVKKRVPLKD